MKTYLLGAILMLSIVAKSQSLPIIFEAESGKAGIDWDIRNELGVEFISIKMDGHQADCPKDQSKLISYAITFPKAGTYELYARVRVGQAGPKDDSFYYAKAFGNADAQSKTDWVSVNNLFNKGFTNQTPEDVVTEIGDGGIGEWKWINLSKFHSLSMGVSFKVKEGMLTQNFIVGGREDGLDIDKFAFGDVKSKYSVEVLNGAKEVKSKK